MTCCFCPTLRLNMSASRGTGLSWRKRCRTSAMTRSVTGKMSGFALSDYLLDIGTPEKYERAQRDCRQYLF